MKLFSTLIVSLIILTANSSYAGGYDYNTTFGTRTFTLNGLYYAGAPGLSSVFSNPAGLGLLNSTALEISIMNKIEQNEFENSIRGFYKSYNNENYSFGGGVYWKISDRIVIGAAYHPFVDYRVDWPFVVLRNTDIRAFSMLNRLEINSISPSISVQFGSFYIGLTGNIYQALNQVNFPRYDGGDTLGASDYQFEYDLDAWAYGGTLGLLYDYNSEFRIGLVAKSAAKIEFEGEAESMMFSDINSAVPQITDVSSEFEIPWKFGLGILYALNPDLMINLDFSYSLWGSTNKERSFVFADQTWQISSTGVDSLSGFSSNPMELNFNNSFDAGLGLEYSTESGLVYRAGYRFSQSPASASTFSFLFPTGDQNILSIGLGYREDNLSIDAGIAYSFGLVKKIEPVESNYLFGEYFTDGYIPSLTLRYEF